MPADEIKDGTWTVKVTRQRGSAWGAWLTRESVLHPRFKRARFVPAEGAAVCIGAEQLRGVLADWLSDPNAHTQRPLKIDVEKGTIDGVPVEIEFDV